MSHWIRSRSWVPAVVVVVGLCLATAAWAKGKKPEKVFGGKILTSDKYFPTKAKSASAYIKQLKKQRKSRFAEDKEKKQWLIYYAAFFRKPLNDMEVTVKIFDVTKGSRMVETYQQFLSQRGQRAITGKFKLKRGDGTTGYNPNSKILVQITGKRNRVLAQARFEITGKVKKNSGKVVFDEDET